MYNLIHKLFSNKKIEKAKIVTGVEFLANLDDYKIFCITDGDLANLLSNRLVSKETKLYLNVDNLTNKITISDTESGDLEFMGFSPYDNEKIFLRTYDMSINL